jgi:hypothetical protein
MLALVHHRSNSAAPEFLQMVAHNFCCALPSWAMGDPSLIIPLLSPSPAQEVLRLTNLLSPQEKVLTLPSERGNFTLATLKPPLSSSFKFSFLHIPREVPSMR